MLLLFLNTFKYFSVIANYWFY